MFRVLNYLVGGVTGNAEAQLLADYEFQESLKEYKSSFGWELSMGRNRNDSTKVLLFKSPVKTTTAENALRRIKTFLHPSVLKYITGQATDQNVFFLTEAAVPLSIWLKYAKGELIVKDDNPLKDFLPSKMEEEKLVSWIMLGLYNVISCLKFLNEDTKNVHGFINENSIFVTENGMWKVACFDMLYEYSQDADPPALFTSNIDKQISSYICPELQSRNFTLISECNSCIIDSYAFGCLMETVFSSLTHPNVIDTSIYKCKNAPLARPMPSKLLSSTFLKHPLVKCIQYLDNKSIKDNEQKFIYYQQLLKYLPSFPDTLCVQYILPLLEDEIYHGDVQLGPYVLPLILFIGKCMKEDDFNKYISPCVHSLFARKDRATRVILLENIDMYINQLSKKDLNNIIFDQICTGFTDTNNKMKEITIRSMLSLADKLNEVNQSKLVVHMSSLQQDPLPAIRTNVIICLGRIASVVPEHIRKQSIFPCIGRALRDVFPKTREQSLKAISLNRQYFDGQFIACKLLPSLCPLLWDVEDNVRSEGFNTVNLLISQLQDYHNKWLKTGSMPTFQAPAAPLPTGAQAYLSSAVNIVSKLVTGQNTTSNNTGNGVTSVGSGMKGTVAPAGVNKSINATTSTSNTTVKTTKVDADDLFNKLDNSNQSNLVSGVSLNFSDDETMNTMNNKDSNNIWNDMDSDIDDSDIDIDNNINKKKQSNKQVIDPWDDDDDIDFDNDNKNNKNKNKDVFINTNVESKSAVKSNNINDFMDTGNDVDLGFEEEPSKEDMQLKQNLAMINQLKNKTTRQTIPPVSSTKGMTLKPKPISSTPLDLDDWANELQTEKPKQTAPVSHSSRRVNNNILKKSTTPITTKTTVSRAAVKNNKNTNNNDGWDDDDDDDIFASNTTNTNANTSSSNKNSNKNKNNKNNDGWDDDDDDDDIFGTTNTNTNNKSNTNNKKSNDGWDDEW